MDGGSGEALGPRVQPRQSQYQAVSVSSHHTHPHYHHFEWRKGEPLKGDTTHPGSHKQPRWSQFTLAKQA